MKKLIVVIFVLIASQSAFAQSGWVVQNSMTLNGLADIDFQNSQTGWAVGDNNTIKKTTNGGDNWLAGNSFTGYNAHGRLVKALGVDTLIVAAYEIRSGNMIYTTIGKSFNGGLNWIMTYEHGINQQIQSLCFINNKTGWFCEYYSSSQIIFITENGGNTWNPVNRPDSANPSGIFFLNQNTGWLLSDFREESFRLHITTTGGSNWKTSYLPAKYTDVKFLNEQTGFICGAGLMKSTNGGVNWTQKFYEAGLKKILLINNSIAVCFGDSGNVWKTVNGGDNWSKVASFGKKLTSGYFVNENTGWVVGAAGLIMKTTNGGVGVTQISSEIPDKYSLSQNYPNPFNPSTVIRYQLSAAGFTTLKVFDLLGKEVAQLVNEKQNAGSYAVNFNSTKFNLPSGIYFYTLNAGEFKETKKMVLIK